ncbi:MAG TPA: GAF domain-containing protein [Methylomirabilota bacterium]
MSPSGLLSQTTDLQAALHAQQRAFPFRSELSLAPLVAFWTRTSTADGSAKAAVARIVSDEVQKAPELLETIDDIRVIERHAELVDLLMTAVFPPAEWEQAYGAALVPFKLQGFYATPPTRQLLMSAAGLVQGRVNLDEARVAAAKAAYGYALILRRLYGIEVDLDYPVVLTVPDPGTGLDRHFRLLFDWQFVDVEAVGGLPDLPEEIRRCPQAKLLDPASLRDALPPSRFVLRGLTVLKAVEVTDQEVLSALKRDLIDRESIVSNTHFLGLQRGLRTLFRRPDLHLGLAAIDGDRVLLLNEGSGHEHGCIFADSAHHRTSEFAGSIFDRAVRSGQPLIVEDVADLPSRTPIEDEILRMGKRNIVSAPLHYQDRIIGTLNLSSPHPGDIDATHLPKLAEVLPLFSMAVQRSMEELNARIQTQMKERFTAIHPVVEWRFRKAVLDTLEQEGDLSSVELNPIVFENVYPLYALADIRGSSTQREIAIHDDLRIQLGLARTVIGAAHEARRLPALDHLLYLIDKQTAALDEHATGGDEDVITFLRHEVESLFDHVADFGPAVRAHVDTYRASLDPRLGVVYRQRRIFEESVTRVAETIGSYLDLEEQAAQTIYPHYFEKQKTDGVDHQLYVGGSLVEGGNFDPLYLKSLRLWQLMVVCGISARADQLTATLPVPLRTTHLVLVQNTPLSIHFRFDEKRFDVAGAYDVRYEIVKKRIDKALIRGTNERVTQPGKIAIVYCQPAEAIEYRGYIEYLQHLGYVGPQVEDLDLEELQGVHGLRALRVTVTLPSPDSLAPLAAHALPAADAGTASAAWR